SSVAVQTGMSGVGVVSRTVSGRPWRRSQKAPWRGSGVHRATVADAATVPCVITTAPPIYTVKRPELGVGEAEDVAGGDGERHHGPAAVDRERHLARRVDVRDEPPRLSVGEGVRAGGAYPADEQVLVEAVQRRTGRSELVVAEPVRRLYSG